MRTVDDSSDLIDLRLLRSDLGSDLGLAYSRNTKEWLWKDCIGCEIQQASPEKQSLVACRKCRTLRIYADAAHSVIGESPILQNRLSIPVGRRKIFCYVSLISTPCAGNIESYRQCNQEGEVLHSPGHMNV